MLPRFVRIRPGRWGMTGSAGIAAGHRTRGKEGLMDRVSLYWKNATAEAVGDEHGVTEKEIKGFAPRVKALTKQMADERKAGKPRLPRLALRRGHARRGQPRGRTLPRPGLRRPGGPGHRGQGRRWATSHSRTPSNPYTYNLMTTGPRRARNCSSSTTSTRTRSRRSSS